jgi:hypothetical protein
VGVQRATKAAVAESHKRILAEVAGLAAHIQDPKALKEQVRALIIANNAFWYSLSLNDLVTP